MLVHWDQESGPTKCPIPGRSVAEVNVHVNILTDTGLLTTNSCVGSWKGPVISMGLWNFQQITQQKLNLLLKMEYKGTNNYLIKNSFSLLGFH